MLGPALSPIVDVFAGIVGQKHNNAKDYVVDDTMEVLRMFQALATIVDWEVENLSSYKLINMVRKMIKCNSM